MIIRGHDHSLSFSAGNIKCDACDDRHLWRNFLNIHCPDCEFTVHRECAFVFSTPEPLDHPSHVGHGLKLLTKGAPDHTDPKCHICGKNTKRLLYHCSVCNLNLDIGCMLDGMCALASLNVPWHHHYLVRLYLGYGMPCFICDLADGYGYFCPLCKLMVHDKCVNLVETSEISHPLHARHSLNLLTDGAPSYTDPECHVCGKHTGIFLYHCAICKFNLDMVCANKDHSEHKPTAIALSNMKVHEHTLTLIPRMISFVCDGCGTKGDRSPYASLRGDQLMFFHQECAALPRVINVNRHDHRVSYKYPLGLGEWECEICLEKIDWSYGAYTCSLCPTYALHSKCATRKDVWDGEELDGVPEEVEDVEPFKTNDDNTITHFAHEHNMSLINKDGIALEESVLCGACVRPIGSYTFYNCSVCSFILHETCANLPKKKRHFLSPRPLTLLSNTEDNKGFTCNACRQLSCTGFMYTDGDVFYDLICSSITVPFIHASHPHPLLYQGIPLYPIKRLEKKMKMPLSVELKKCRSCSMDVYGISIGCIKCDYFLDFRCATLPQTVTLARYDDHPLTLIYGEKEETSGKYWCDICERETNPEEWFYTCSRDCGVTLHVFCVLGNIRYAKPGGSINKDTELMFSNKSTRPFCDNCHCRCAAPFFLIRGKERFCTYYCLRSMDLGVSHVGQHCVRPPWFTNEPKYLKMS